ncbi:MAG: hypothetical protein AAGA20_12195 [Planctomycetota bacterium]
MLVTLLLAVAAQDAFAATVHRPPAGVSAAGKRIAVEGDLLVALRTPSGSPPAATFWRWSLDGWEFEEAVPLPREPSRFGHAVAIANGDVFVVTTEFIGGAMVDVLTHEGGTWTHTATVQVTDGFSHGTISETDLVVRNGFVHAENTYLGHLQRLQRSTAGHWQTTNVGQTLGFLPGSGHSTDSDDDWYVTGDGIADVVQVSRWTPVDTLGARTFLTSSFSADTFGGEVELEDGLIVVRSFFSGPLEAFRFDGTNWTSIGAVPIPGGYSAQLVKRMDLRDGVLTLGLPEAEVGGLVIDVHYDGGAWTPGTTRRPIGPSDDGLGREVVRTPYGVVAAGNDFFCRWPDDVNVTDLCGCPTAIALCGNAASFGRVNSVGGSGRLRVAGSNSIATSNLSMFATGLPASTWGTLFHGSPGGSPAATGNGLLCLSGSLWRYAPTLANGGAILIDDVVGFDRANHPPAGRLVDGESFGFQLWYRDVGGPCGAASNLTSAVKVRFEH